MSKIPTTKAVGYGCKNCQFYNIKKSYCSYMKIHVGENDCKGYYYADKKVIPVIVLNVSTFGQIQK